MILNLLVGPAAGVCRQQQGYLLLFCYVLTRAFRPLYLSEKMRNGYWVVVVAAMSTDASTQPNKPSFTTRHEHAYLRRASRTAR